MQISKRFCYIFSGLGLGLLGICGGILLTSNSRTAPEDALPSQTPAAIQISSPATPTEESPAPTPYVGVHYFLQAEDQQLVLYLIDGGQKTRVKQADIQPAMLPPADSTMLKTGIRLHNLEDSIPYFEDFTS